LPIYSFFCLIDGNISFCSTAKIVADAENARFQSSGTLPWESSQFGRIPEMPYFFDWMYTKLTPEERLQYKDYLVAGSIDWDGQSGTESGLEKFLAKADNQPWAPVSHYIGFPLSIFGEGYNDTAASEGMNIVYSSMNDRFMPVMDELYGGGCVRGYSGVRVDAMLAMAEMIRTSTDQDFFAQSDFLRNLGYFTNSRLRGDGYFADGVGKYSVGSEHPAQTSYILAARYDDPTYQYLSNYWADHAVSYFSSISDIFGVMYPLIWYNPDKPAGSLSSFPLAWDCELGGIVYMKSNARDYFDPAYESDIHAGFFNGPSLVSGEIGAQNHFLIGRGNDALIIHGALYDITDATPWFNNWFQKTVSYNGLLVYDPSEVYGGSFGLNDGGSSTHGNVSLGQTYYSVVNGLEGPEDIAYRGRIRFFQADNDFTYMRGIDAHNAYRPGKLSEWTRDFVYLRPDIFIVFDRVNSSNQNWEKSIVLHTINEPQLNGNTIRLEGSTYGGIFESIDSTQFYADRNTSRIFSKVLLPIQSQVKMRKIGGANSLNQHMRQTWDPSDPVTYSTSTAYEWFYADQNNPISPDWSQNGIDQRNDHPVHVAGDWRIEVISKNIVNKDYFLNILWPTSNSTQSMIETSLIDSNDFAGAVIGTNKALIFAKRDGIISASTTLPLPTTGIVSFIIVGLPPSTGYNILVASQTLSIFPGSAYTTSINGVLSFEAQVDSLSRRK